MCGINGIWSENNVADLPSAVQRMNTALQHRGPDDAGIFSDGNICLGHRRLSIIDLSAAGHQPMFSDDGTLAVVFNGEIYNYRQVKNAIPDYNFKTNSDTEVLLAAWMKWGVKCLDRFNGMFAFALYDKNNRELHIVRDRLGVKPLYYSEQNGALIFSSELRSLLASARVDRKLDSCALEEYLRYQTVFAPRTIIRNVKMLLPGHYMKVKAGRVNIQQWWKPNSVDSERPADYKSACTHVNRLFNESVELRMISDVPFGAFLSGGIDSTAVAGVMSRISSGKISTFNITFDDSEFSESVYARAVAKKFSTDHHEIVLTPEQFLEKLPYALSAMDHPSGDGPNTYVVSEATKAAGITMALSGLGGDELFCGYDIFKRAYSLEQKSWLNSVPRSVRKLGGAILTTVRPGVSSSKVADVLALDRIELAQYYPKSREVLNESHIRNLVKVETGWRFPSSDSVYGGNLLPETNNILSRVSLAEITTYMQNILLRDTDQMSMAHALEVREPFLDFNLVEYVLQLPDAMKYPSSPKKLFVDSMGDLLPTDIVNRPKMGFTLPWKNWMRNELRDFCKTNLQVLAGCNGLNGSAVWELYERFQKGDSNVTWSRIWHLVVLGYWIQRNNIETE